jgi:crotonobetainyl-CoA:carnitine CoA-transferase CaiB-like acyl-CoA transferase
MRESQNVGTEKRRPLDGIRVIDLSNYVSGPFAGMMLGDLGAEVIKVEQPKGGDPTRRIGRRLEGGISGLFFNTNRNKRSIALDLKAPEDNEILLGLVERSDIFLENWRPGVGKRLGLGTEVLHKRNAGLIHLALSGYGLEGPLVDQGALDPLLQGISGLSWFNKHGGVPEGLRFYVADKIAAVFAVQSVLGALLLRQQGQRRQRIDLNMLDAFSYFNFPDLFISRTMLGEPDVAFDPEEIPGPKTMIRCRDAFIVVAPSTGVHVQRACQAAGHPEWVDELKPLRDFRDLAPALMGRLSSVTANMSTEDALAMFRAADVPVGPVLDLDAHLSHPQVLANGIYVEADHSAVGPHRFARYPVRFTDNAVESLPCPELDEHRHEVMGLVGDKSRPL